MRRDPLPLVSLPCSGRTRLFFSGFKLDQADAKALCEGCPKREPCLELAFKFRLFRGDSGVWGGTTPAERRAMYRAQRDAA